MSSSIVKRTIPLKRGICNNNQYNIELVCDSGEHKCKLFDSIDASNLVDAYVKATELASELNDKIDRENAFSIVEISKKN